MTGGTQAQSLVDLEMAVGRNDARRKTIYDQMRATYSVRREIAHYTPLSREKSTLPRGYFDESTHGYPALSVDRVCSSHRHRAHDDLFGAGQCGRDVCQQRCGERAATERTRFDHVGQVSGLGAGQEAEAAVVGEEVAGGVSVL